jgi:hypothetical protein
VRVPLPVRPELERELRVDQLRVGIAKQARQVFQITETAQGLQPVEEFAGTGLLVQVTFRADVEEAPCRRIDEIGSGRRGVLLLPARFVMADLLISAIMC